MELGIGELIFIFVLALLLFGPKKLPEIGRTLAKAMNDFKSASNEFKSTLEAEVAKLEQETKLEETYEAIRNPMQTLVARGQQMLTEAVSVSPTRTTGDAEPLVIDAELAAARAAASVDLIHETDPVEPVAHTEAPAHVEATPAAEPAHTEVTPKGADA
jgi:TatA/E family protein of Tat protein translocase